MSMYISMKYHDHIRAAKTAAEKAADILRNYRKNLAKINADQDLSEKGKDSLRNAATAAASGELDSIFGDAHAAIDRTEQLLAEILERSDNDHTAELKEQRAWRRYERMLEAGKDPLQVIQAAADDPVGLRALQADLPAYIQSTRHSDPGYIQSIRGELDRVEETHLSADQREAKKRSREVEAGKYNLQITENAARTETRGGSPAAALVNWDRSVTSLLND